ncbi:hypothetical protein OAJ77_03190 [Rhodospirillales bacterium]|nr:hypothetical protein [Rhodospirillales bacterium]
MTRDVRAAFLVIRALVPTVVPWKTAPAGSPLRSRYLSTPVTAPAARFSGVESTLKADTNLPVLRLRASTSVKVPPTSIPSAISGSAMGVSSTTHRVR